ncbi:MAG: hypothetical protein CMN63_06905 [Sphingobium sp.]|nr:hypothetical protein [Sphingobium sp.]
MNDHIDLSGLHQGFLQSQRATMKRARDVADAAAGQLTQAKNAVAGLVADIAYFESCLDPTEEARLVIIGGPAGTAIFPESLCPLGMDRIRYEGSDETGARVAVIQHVSQLNVMLKAVRVGEENARRIGFHTTGS